MLCARVVRGTSSTENELTPAAAICWIDFGRTKRTQKAYEQLITTQQGKISLAGEVIGPVAKHLHDNVSGSKYSSAIRKNLSALLDIG